MLGNVIVVGVTLAWIRRETRDLFQFLYKIYLNNLQNNEYLRIYHLRAVTKAVASFPILFVALKFFVFSFSSSSHFRSYII